MSEIKSQEGHNFFAIEADEIRDISNWEQLGIAVRYIKNHNAVERIIAYVDCESTTEESIYVTQLFSVSLIAALIL